VSYPDSYWMVMKSPQAVTTIVSTPADAFMTDGSTVRDLPATARQEVASAINEKEYAMSFHE